MNESMKSAGEKLRKEWKWVLASISFMTLNIALIFDASNPVISFFLLAFILSNITLIGWIRTKELMLKVIPEKIGWWATSAIGTVFCTVIGGCLYFINPADAPATLNEAMLFDAILREGSFMEARAVETVFFTGGLIMFMITIGLIIKKMIPE